MSERFACAECGLTLPLVEPQLFSFNSPRGACAVCHGLGVRTMADVARMVPDAKLSLRGGALAPFKKQLPREIEAYARSMGVDLHAAWRDLPARARDELLHGDGDSFPGALALLERRARVRARSRDDDDDGDGDDTGSAVTERFRRRGAVRRVPAARGCDPKHSRSGSTGRTSRSSSARSISDAPARVGPRRHLEESLDPRGARRRPRRA